MPLLDLTNGHFTIPAKVVLSPETTLADCEKHSVKVYFSCGGDIPPVGRSTF